MAFDDGVQGHITQDVEHAVGDFVVMRADGLTAYQLAVVVDDAAQGITNVVRGADLLDSTPRQIWLQQQLKVATPCYAHLPVALNAQGEKLSKQTHAVAIDRNQPVPELINALAFLHHAPPPELRNAEIGDLWEWALRNWRLARLPPVRGAVAYL
jgi:glutamyl-Q tRNA(Asp) synthetase